MYYKEDIYDSLTRINKRLAKNNLYLNLKIVGGAALIFNGINTIETNDIDTINRIEEEIKEICADCSLDINDDALDYIGNYNDCEFIYDNEKSFSNITIEYLSLGSCIKTKLKNCQDEDKMEKLIFLLEDTLRVDMTIEGISEYLSSLGEIPNEYDIEEFLKAIDYL